MSMMTARLTARLDSIVADYRNGNRSDAAHAIRRLSKVELALLLTEDQQLPNEFAGDALNRYDFQKFVVTALDGRQ